MANAAARRGHGFQRERPGACRMDLVFFSMMKGPLWDDVSH